LRDLETIPNGPIASIEEDGRLNLLTLHRAEDRRAYFAAGPKPIFFDDALRCWIVTDPELAERLFQHTNVGGPDCASAYQTLQRQSGIAFPNLLHAFRHIPLCLNDGAHREARRRLAEAISRRRTVVSSALPQLVSRWFGPLAVAGEVEVMEQILLPLIDEVMGLLVGIDAEAVSQFRRMPAILDRMIGLRRGKQLEAEVGVARAVLDSKRQDADPLLALMTLGHDALLGTIGESLHHLVATHPGQRLSDIAYPPVPVETGVPYIERAVREAFAIDGISLDRGDRIRILIQAFVYSESPQDRLRMFGGGPRACLGRQLSLDLWGEVTAALAQIRRRAEIVKHALRTDDYVWTCPSELRIRLHDDDL
jgi:cytochrome P450